MRRAQFDETNQIHRNLATNPSMVSALAAVTQRQNFVTNPRFAGTNGFTTVRTNLLTNPNLETVGSTNITARTNLATNPSMEAASGQNIVRTNLVNSSRGVSALDGYGQQTITANVPITGHPEGFTTALRVAYTAGNSNPGVILVNPTESGVTYYMSAWVYHETPGGGPQAFAQMGVMSSPSTTPVQGVWQKLSWVRTSSGTSALGFRVSSQSSDGSYLITGMQVEKSMQAVPYFDALTTTTNKAPNPSMSDSTGTVTLRSNVCVNPRPSTTFDYSLGATGTATTFTGGKPAVQATANGTQTPYVFSARSSVAVAAGETYALSSLVEFSSGVGRVHIRAHRRSTNEYFTSGQTINYDPTGKGVHRVSVIFTAPSAIAANDLDFSLVFYNSAGAVPPSGEWARMGEVLIERAGSVMPFFDGATTSTADFTYSWAGTANSTASYQRGTNAYPWNPRWYGNGGGAGYTYRSTGTGVDGGYSIRKVWTTTNTTSSLDVGIETTINVVGGATYTASIYQKSSVDQWLTCFAEWKDAAGATISVTSRAVGVATPANTWVRGSATLVAPDNAVSGKFVFGPYLNSGPMPEGSYIDWDRGMIEESPALRAYQDGTAEAPGDFTYGWAGTIHNSASRMYGSIPSGYSGIATQSSEWALNGVKSMRITPSSTTSKDTFSAIPFTFQTGKTYTISATIRLESPLSGDPDIRARKIVVYHSNTQSQSAQATNVAGETRLSLTFTCTDGSLYQNARLYNGHRAGEGDVWWDSVLIEEADHEMPYFDGSTAPGPDMTHVWSGTAHASTSLMRVDLPSGASNSGQRIAHLSTEWAARGTKSIKIPHLYAAGGTNNDNFIEIQNMISGGLKANTTYTISGTCRTSQVLGGTLSSTAMGFRVTIDNVGVNVTMVQSKSNTAGVGRVVGTFTTPASFTSLNFVRLYGGATYGNGDVWWDEICLEEGKTDGSYFDGGYSAKENLAKTSATAITGATVVHNISFQGLTWSRVTASIGSAGTGVRQNVALADLSQGATYTVSVTVHNENSVAVSIVSFDWCDRGAINYTLQPGETKRLTISTSKETYDSTYRFADINFMQSSTEARSLLFRDWIIERGTTSGEYYSGQELEPVWTGTTNASTSTLRAPALLGWSRATSGEPYQSKIPGIIGSNAAGVLTKGTNGDGIYHADINCTAGKSYTFSAWVKITEAVPTMSMVLRFKDGVGASGGAILLDGGGTVTSSLVVGQWVRVSATAVSPSGAAKIQPLIRMYATHTPTSFFVDGAMVEEESVMYPYFDGATASTTDITYAWAGAANTSSSVLKAAPVVGQIASKSGSNPDSRFLAYQVTTEDGAKAIRFIGPAGTPSSGWRVAGVGSAGADFSQVKAGRQYTLWFRWRSWGWASASNCVVQISTGSSTNHVTTNTQYIQMSTSPSVSAASWQEYRKTFTALRDGEVGQILYIGLPPSTSTAQDGVFELREWALYEGEYTGDFIDGSKPLSKWEGTANASTSIGYPTQLRDLVGTPVLDLTTTGNMEQAVPAGSDIVNADARTFYTVLEVLQVPGTAVLPYVTYGLTGLQDTPVNQTVMLRAQGSSSVTLLNRRTGGGGPTVSGVPLFSRVVACWGISDTGVQFVQFNGGSTIFQSQVMDVPHQSIRIHADGTLNGLPATRHIRTLMFKGYHSPELRDQFSGYLANKYGGYVE